MKQMQKKKKLTPNKILSCILLPCAIALSLSAYVGDQTGFLGDMTLQSYNPKSIQAVRDKDIGLLLNPLDLTEDETLLFQKTERFLAALQLRNSTESFYDPRWEGVLNFLIAEQLPNFLDITQWYLGDFSHESATLENKEIPVKFLHPPNSVRPYSYGYLVWSKTSSPNTAGNTDTAESKPPQTSEWLLSGFEVNLSHNDVQLDSYQPGFDEKEPLFQDSDIVEPEGIVDTLSN